MLLPVGRDKTKYMTSIRVRSGSMVHIMKASLEYVIIMVSIARHFELHWSWDFVSQSLGLGSLSMHEHTRT